MVSDMQKALLTLVVKCRLLLIVIKESVQSNSRLAAVSAGQKPLLTDEDTVATPVERLVPYDSLIIYSLVSDYYWNRICVHKTRNSA